MSDQIVLEVIEKYAQRSEIGIAKYGTIYLQKLMSLDKEITKLVKDHSNDTELGMKIRNLVR